MRNVLIVVDVQNDFVTGALRNEMAMEMIPRLAAKVQEHSTQGDCIIFTRDTHYEGYFHTQEGLRLPVEHCRKGTEGWQIVDELASFVREDLTFDKVAFGDIDIASFITEKAGGYPDQIFMCGICTDICVITNAFVLKAAFPEARISVYKDSCAGVTEESHNCALQAMESAQIDII